MQGSFFNVITAAHCSLGFLLYQKQELQSLQRYVPAVFANVVEVCQLAVSHLSGVVLEQRHPPHSVTCHNTSLCRWVCARTHTHTLLVSLRAEGQR